MTPLSFHRHVEGYRRNTDREWYQWRELFALTFNINRGEKTPAITGKEVYPLVVDEATDKAQKNVKKYKTISQKKYERLMAIGNQ